MVIVEWVKRNKLTCFLLLVVAILVLKSFSSSQPRYSSSLIGDVSNPKMLSQSAPSFGIAMPRGGVGADFYSPSAPTPEVTNRMVVSDSELSLLVKNVNDSLAKIKAQTVLLGGYMVESNLSRPDDAPTGQITLRIPSTKLDEGLVFFRSLSLKVVSENLHGTDVTDQFVDNDARLAVLIQNKARFTEIMNRAVNVDEILRVQQEIFNLQSQIDAIKGQQNYLLKTSETAKVSVYLSTDELALPYTPNEPWRPDVVLKRAVRSLLTTAQSIGSLLIWVVVYSVIWAPVLGVVIVIRRRKKGVPTASS